MGKRHVPMPPEQGMRPARSPPLLKPLQLG
jgi:hypothetical protein